MSFPADVRPLLSRPQGGQLWPCMFLSKTLGVRCNVFVYLPPGVSPRSPRLRRLPVAYLLHGMWGSEVDWPFRGGAADILDREIAARRIPPMIVAMPHDGLADNGTFYSNWHADPARRFEDYFTGDLMDYVEKELLGGRRPRDRRVIAGLSMGGFGALALSMRHPDLFVAAASMSGATRPVPAPGFEELGVRIFGPFVQCKANRRGHDPYHLIELPTSRDVALYLDCGRGDFLLAMNRKMHAKMTRLDVPHRYVEYAGAHDWPSWRKRLPHVLRFLASCLRSGGGRK